MLRPARLTTLILSSAVVSLAAGAMAQEPARPAPARGSRSQSVLPLLGDLVPPEYRADMPLPFGVSLGGVWMTQLLPLSDTRLTLNGVLMPSGVLNAASIKSASAAKGARVDAWLFPFLNVYAMAARVTGDISEIHLQGTGAGATALVLPASIHYTGSGYGVGVTPAIGYKRAFVLYDLNWSWVTTDVQDASVRVFNHGPRVGVSVGTSPLQAAVYAGAVHQSLSLRQTGSIDLLFGAKLDYDVIAAPESAWNTLAGCVIVISRHLVIDVEQGFGSRRHTVVGVGGRF